MLKGTITRPAGAGPLDHAPHPRAKKELPWPECPAAAASASRLGGQPVANLRDVVRQEFTGITTCTHLNDLLRSLADVATLADALGALVG